MELFAKIRQTRKIANLLNTTCLIFQSGKDEMVSSRTEKYFKDNPNFLVNRLNKSSHYYYDKEDFNFLISEFNKMLSPNDN